MSKIPFKLYSSLLVNDFYMLKMEAIDFRKSKKVKVYDYSLVIKSFHQFISLLTVVFRNPYRYVVLVQTMQDVIVDFFEECFSITDFKIGLCSETFKHTDILIKHNLSILLCSLENSKYLSTNKQINHLLNFNIILQLGGNIDFNKALIRIYRLFAVFDSLKKLAFLFILINKVRFLHLAPNAKKKKKKIKNI